MKAMYVSRLALILTGLLAITSTSSLVAAASVPASPSDRNMTQHLLVNVTGFGSPEAEVDPELPSIRQDFPIDLDLEKAEEAGVKRGSAVRIQSASTFQPDRTTQGSTTTTKRTKNGANLVSANSLTVLAFTTIAVHLLKFFANKRLIL